MKAVKTIAVLTAAALAPLAQASGYHFGTQSVTAQGTANAIELINNEGIIF